ncbi:dihydrodipicolinate synthase family protein [Mesorhizobium sp. BR1-1-16]|uniref:dihydrodipicolinate synthase family protein n=1 Tax=Mesorhizobium sp. BR1-1-16 TaxID=2876653 RepID=UPI001CCB2196|nr:dihydrodipicolinate synthase family protein [Mesorhizobium sp. BR1-1-16]MBZ9936057.1 dihydrodipicolinate synthase family protein [Mesorhizobium sp. BR1-1-16]
MTSIQLPTSAGTTERYMIRNAPLPPPRKGAAPAFSRVAYAAAHVVVDPFADNNPTLDVAFDWERTLAFRHHLWDLGFGVAEAMDTAQRGMGLSWAQALELSQRAIAEAKSRPGAVIACGAGTDHLEPGPDVTIDQVIAAYEMQVEAIQSAGGRIILMASRALARAAEGPDDYIRVYDRILSAVKEPVVIHWLGEMFDPALAGYWGSADHMTAMETALSIINSHADKVDGVKISLLSADKEIAMRRRLAPGVKMYTGDDFNYAELIAGDSEGYSHALLGIFDAIAPAASLALEKLAANDTAGFHDILAPTVPLSRHIFKAPTRFYKTGVVFLAWLNGHQEHFLMAGGQQSARSLVHFAELFRLADAARCLADPDQAAGRMASLLKVGGLDQ